MTPPLMVDYALEYPSAASFPDLDLGIPITNGPRQRFRSTSESDLTQHSCHQSLDIDGRDGLQRLELGRQTTFLRQWKVEKKKKEEKRGQRRTHNWLFFQIL